MSSRRVLRDLSEAATPGEWRVEPMIRRAESKYGLDVSIPLICTGDGRTWDAIAETGFASPDENAALIVAARNSLPGLLDRLDTAETALRQVVGFPLDDSVSAEWHFAEVRRIAREALAALEEA